MPSATTIPRWSASRPAASSRPELEPGMQVEGLPEGAVTEDMPRDAIYIVTEVYPEHVVLDGNHPLAGVGLRMHLKVLDVRGSHGRRTRSRQPGRSGVSAAWRRAARCAVALSARFQRARLTFDRFKPCQSSRNRPHRAAWRQSRRQAGSWLAPPAPAPIARCAPSARSQKHSAPDSSS